MRASRAAIRTVKTIKALNDRVNALEDQVADLIKKVDYLVTLAEKGIVPDKPITEAADLEEFGEFAKASDPPPVVVGD